jgi:hypothetical protein
VTRQSAFWNHASSGENRGRLRDQGFSSHGRNTVGTRIREFNRDGDRALHSLLSLTEDRRGAPAARRAAASEKGEKNALIEANGGETQVDGQQEIGTKRRIPAAKIEPKSESCPVKLVIGSLKFLRRSLPRVAGLNPER